MKTLIRKVMNDLLKDWLVCGFFLCIGIFIGVTIPLTEDMIEISKLQKTVDTEYCLQDSLDFDFFRPYAHPHTINLLILYLLKLN